MKKYIYDNSNIAESYSGVTTPLTYSFARYAYQEVYKYFCRMMGVRAEVIKQHEDMFSRMIVFIGHRMYYDLMNWYTLVSFLPGYRFNKGFFEKMLGVQEHRDDNGDKDSGIFQKYFVILPRLLFQTAGVVFSFIIMGCLIKKFNRKFDHKYSEIDAMDLSRLSLKQLDDLCLTLHKTLVSEWGAPIANDFAVMVSTGVADKFFKKWLDEPNVYSYLYSRSRDPLVSLDPGFEMLKIASLIKNDPLIADIFERQRDNSSIMSILTNDFTSHLVTQSVLQYLRKFGSRSPNELKLETVTLREKPEIFVELLKNLVKSNDSTRKGPLREERIKPQNYDTLSPIKKFIINRSLGWAINSIKRREETRFRRALIFGFARKTYLVIGEKFRQNGMLSFSCDIFYLTKEEISEFISAGKSGDALKALVRGRITEFEYWKTVELPRRNRDPEDYRRT